MFVAVIFVVTYTQIMMEFVRSRSPAGGVDLNGTNLIEVDRDIA